LGDVDANNPETLIETFKSKNFHEYKDFNVNDKGEINGNIA
jgi:hypothetical protein